MTVLALNPAPLAPAWVAFPMGILTMLVLLAHGASLREAPMPESRRRIRSANAVLMMCAVPLLTYALAVVTPANAKAFVIAWTSVVCILGLILLLALADVLNTLRLRRREVARLRAEAKAIVMGSLAHGARVHSASTAGPAAGPPRTPR
ncbi:MAG: hypothetical protein IT439_10830 [Phycisphaerales bacterium]|nr:hypothetical protein [Phycisphaerales bacterium]